LLGWGWRARTADLTLHSVPEGTPADVDMFLVRGVAGADFSGGGVGFEIASFPAVEVKDYESPIEVSVHRQNPDGTLGSLVGDTVSAAGCDSKTLTFPLKDGDYYYVTVRGAP